MKLRIAFCLSLALIGCGSQPPQPTRCSDAQLRCYSGNNIDLHATQKRYGSEGAVRLFQDQF